MLNMEMVPAGCQNHAVLFLLDCSERETIERDPVLDRNLCVTPLGVRDLLVDT